MLPASYRRKDGTVDVEGMERAARLLLYLDVDPMAALGDTFVIHDQVGFKADLQPRAILTRPGSGYDFELLEVDDVHAVARIKTPSRMETAADEEDRRHRHRRLRQAKPGQLRPETGLPHARGPGSRPS